jgi:hypothetical protein
MASAKLLRKFPYVRNSNSDNKPLSWASTAVGAQRAKPTFLGPAFPPSLRCTARPSVSVEGQQAKNVGLALPPGGLVQAFAPNGAASNQTF